jgi:hypothetical protein
MSHFGTQQLLRRTLIGGYRVADVEVLLAQFRLLISQLDTELRATRDRLEAAEADRKELNRRVDEARQRELAVIETATQLRRSHDAVEQSAQLRSREITSHAEAEAARIRGEASLDADSARSQVDELLRLRDTLSSTMRGIVRDFEGVVGRIDRNETPAKPPIAAVPAVADTHVPPEWAAPAEPAPPPAPYQEPAARDSEPIASRSVFDRQIELDAGPFSDFSSLSAFERSLGGLPKVEDVYIRRFEGDRATIDVTLVEPAPLLHEMNERMPYRLDVQSAVADRISVTVSAVAAAS